MNNNFTWFIDKISEQKHCSSFVWDFENKNVIIVFDNENKGSSHEFFEIRILNKHSNSSLFWIKNKISEKNLTQRR